MSRTLTRARFVALLAALPLALALQSRVSGQDPALEAFYTKLEPKEQFKYKWKGKEAVCTAGVFHWELLPPEKGGQFGTGGLDRNRTGYCAEVLVPIHEGKTYRFRLNLLHDPALYDGVKALENKDNQPNAAKRRVTYLQELFGRYYRDPLAKDGGPAKPVNPVDAAAFQVAIWEIIQETEPVDGNLKLDLFAGDFQANYAKAAAPEYVTRAQEFLSSLTGDDTLYYSNPDIRGRELVYLKGTENAEGVVAQSQLALRYVGGGGTGSVGGSRALTAGGAFGPGFGAPGGALGSGGGGGGLVTNPNNPNNGTGTTVAAGSAVPTTSPVTTTTTTTPSSTPPTTTVTTPPTGGPENPKNPNNPVPAPAGLLLGAIALGTLASWRLGARLLGAK